MARNNAISKEARSYIKETIREMGEVSVEEVVDLVRVHYSFDPIAAKEREINNYARRLLVSVRSKDGTRSVLAVDGQPGRFVNIESCKNPFLMQKIDTQIDRKWEGLSKIRAKVKRIRAEIEGQQSLYAPSPTIQESYDRA